MGNVRQQPDADFVADTIVDLSKKVEDLQRLVALGFRQYTDSNRPGASTMKGAVIFNTTQGKHQGSDGTNWNNLY